MTLVKNILYCVLFAIIFALHPDLNKGNDPIVYFQKVFTETAIITEVNSKKQDTTKILNTDETLISQK